MKARPWLGTAKAGRHAFSMRSSFLTKRHADRVSGHYGIYPLTYCTPNGGLPCQSGIESGCKSVSVGNRRIRNFSENPAA